MPSDLKAPDPTIPAAGFADTPVSDKPTYDELVEALRDMLRIVEAYRYSAGLGEKQRARYDAASVIARKASEG